MLFDREQQGVPVSAVRQDGSGFFSEKLGEHEYVGMKPKAMALQMTTPSGWNTDRHANKKRRFYQAISSLPLQRFGLGNDAHVEQTRGRSRCLPECFRQHQSRQRL